MTCFIEKTRLPADPPLCAPVSSAETNIFVVISFYLFSPASRSIVKQNFSRVRF